MKRPEEQYCVGLSEKGGGKSSLVGCWLCRSTVDAGTLKYSLFIGSQPFTLIGFLKLGSFSIGLHLWKEMTF